MLKNGSEINKVGDLFVGAGNLTFDNLYLYDKYNVKKVYMNDFNTVISSTYYNIQNHKEEVINEFSEIIFWIKEKFNKIKIHKEEDINVVKQYVVTELNKRIFKRIFDSKTTALFLYCQHQSRSGKIDYDMESKELTYKSFRSSSNSYKFESMCNIINKIEFYSQALNIMDIEILNEDYNNIIRDFNNKDCLLVIDSPYASSEEEELISTGTNYSDIVIEKIDFGNGFNQVNLLEYIKEHKGSYIYWNNHHKDIELFSSNDLKDSIYEKIPVIYGDSKEETLEIYMYINYLTVKDYEDLNILEELMDEYEYEKSIIENCDSEMDEYEKSEFYKSRYNLFAYFSVYKKRNEEIPYIGKKLFKEYEDYLLEQPSF